MNRRVEMSGQSEPQPRPREEREDVLPTEGFLPVRELEEAHPLGPEAEPEESRREDRAKASRIFESLRNHPLTRPIFFALALLMGSEMLPNIAKSKSFREASSEVEAALSDVGVRSEFARLVFSELRESGAAFSEVEGRYGRDQWSQEERLEYADIPTLEGKFEYLHKDNPKIVDAYRSAQGRVENFGALFHLMSNEFRHSRLPFDFVEQTTNDAIEILPQLEPAKALEVYTAYEKDLLTFAGLKPVRVLVQQLSEVLPPGHLILARIDQKQWLAPEADAWFGSSKDNFMLFDQQAGRVEVYHQVSGQVILLEAFPANGGPPNGAAWERGMPAHVAVRTPDGEYTFDQAFEKKSASWKNSWVTDTAPLRWTQDQKNVEYQDTDGIWRRLTGEDAEFVVYGASQKPFKDKGKSTLYQWSSQRLENGSLKRPTPFTVADALGSDGQLRSQWDRNDFGPKSIQIKDGQGKRMSIFFHSSPTDEQPGEFLDFSHGCIHMKPADLESSAEYLEKGSRIRISAFEAPTKVAQTKKPGSDTRG